MTQSYRLKLSVALTFVLLPVLLSGCGLRAPQVRLERPLSQFKYAYIVPTGYVDAISTYSVDDRKIPYTKSINPRSLIAGQLAKRGYIVVPEVSPHQAHQTMVVSYGESDKRGVLIGGYAIEVTIQIITADTQELVAITTAEGSGLNEPETEYIRRAISLAFTALFEPQQITSSDS